MEQEGKRRESGRAQAECRPRLRDASHQGHSIPWCLIRGIGGLPKCNDRYPEKRRRQTLQRSVMISSDSRMLPSAPMTQYGYHGTILYSRR